MRSLSNFLLCLGFSLGFCLVAVSAQALETGQEFQQWKTKCVDDERGGDACHIYQNLVVEQDGDSQKTVRMSVGFPPGAASPVTVIRLPLSIWLTNGITLTVDDNEGQQFPVQICASSGCQTTLRLEPDVVETLKQGNRLMITTYNARQQPVQIPIDLRGFSAALAALQDN